MAKKKAEIVYIVHAIRGGKPRPMDADKFNASKSFIFADGWRLAKPSEVANYYDIEEVKTKKTEKKAIEEVENKEQK